MSSTEHRDGEGVPHQYDWRTYETPTKTTAHILEELIGSGESPKSHRTKSSSTGSFVVVEPQTQGTQTKAPLTPLPIYPPTYHPESASEITTSPPPPPPPHPHQPSKSESDVTENEEKSSQFHRARDSIISSNNPRRISDEARAHHRKSESASPKGTTATTTTTTTTDTSPTDSHPQRFHTHNHNHNHRDTRTHTHTHTKSRSSSESLSSLLLVTTERLSRETARANEAERNAAELMSLFKNTYETKVKLERDLIRVQQELEMYKVQLNVAQKEIYRAQDVVDRVDRERVAAQEEAARARDKIHKLNEARAVQLAMEEGRRSGFEEGLRQGRRVQPVSVREALQDEVPRHRHSRSDEVSRYTYPDQNQDPSPSSDRRRSSSRPPPSSQPERPGSKAPPHRTETVPATQPVPVPPMPSSSTSAPPPAPAHRHGTPPDVGNFQKLLPRPTITTPMPVQVPSTQPQPPPPMPPHQAPMHMHQHQHQQRRSSQPASHSPHPEKIAVQPSSNGGGGGGAGRIHPIPVWNTPSVMHERIDLPPDNYIPTMDANSMIISLPPPHELSRPVPAEAPLPQVQVPIPPQPQPQPQTQKNNGVPQADQAQRPRSRSQGRTTENIKRGSLRLVDHDERETIKSKDYSYYQTQAQAPTHREREKARHEYQDDDDDDGTSSLKYSTLSGPRQKYATMRSKARAPSSPGAGWGVLSPSTSTRLSDLDLLSPPRDAYENNRSRSPIGDEGRYDYDYNSKRYENPVYRVRADDARAHAPTPSPPQRIAQEWRDANREYFTPPSKNVEPPRPPSAAQSIPRPPSRRAREVVMPVPLADVFMNTLKSPRLEGQPFSDRTTPSGSTANNAVPGIEVVTPSTHASTRLSLRTIVDPVLLSPESANRPLPLPDPQSRPQSSQSQSQSTVIRQEDGTYFVPLSPVSDLKPYPPGFAPSLPQGRDREGMGADFKYPSSPLRR